MKNHIVEPFDVSKTFEQRLIEATTFWEAYHHPSPEQQSEMANSHPKRIPWHVPTWSLAKDAILFHSKGTAIHLIISIRPLFPFQVFALIEDNASNQKLI